MVFGDTSEDVDDKVISPRFLFLSIPQTFWTRKTSEFQKQDIIMNNERVTKQILANPPQKPTSAIVLYGAGACGKSLTLQHLIVLLCGGGRLMPAIQAAFENRFYDAKHNRYRDADVVVHYPTKGNKTIPIYISTDGDSWPIVEDNFRFFYHCVRSKHKAYEYDGKDFIEIDDDGLKKLKRPEFCITAANYTHFGGIQAAHYYLNLTCDDWMRELWIRKYKEPNQGSPVAGYKNCDKIREIHDKIAKKIIEKIDQMINETLI